MSAPGLRRLFGAIVLCSVAGQATRAAADVPLPGTQPADFDDPLNEFRPLNPSQGCLQCHGGGFSVLPSEPFDGWAGSMMGNAVLDPVFLAALSVAEDDLPGVGDFCLRCHAPEAWIEGRSTPTDGSALEFRDDGVTCHLCHRLVPDDPLGVDTNAPYIGNARWFIAKESRMHGPYDNVTLSPHETIQEPYVSEPGYCGLCHDISNPLVPWRDEDGNELGPEFPLERTYSEWLRSAFPGEDQTCQTCHMAPVQGIACNVAGVFEREIYMHQLAGANTWVPQALQFIWGNDRFREGLWADAVLAGRDMLRNAAELSFESVPATITPGAALDFSVRVTNLTGHKLPTGYPEGRRMWLEVVVTNAARDRMLESGTYDAATATRLDDEQLRAYEVQLGVAGQGPSLHFALNDVILSDTRIPPRGYAPLPDDSGLVPVGRDYPDGPDGLAHWDVAPYEVRVSCNEIGPLRIQVRLMQQTASREYIEFLRDTQTTALGQDRGATLFDAWEQSGKSTPEVMEELETTVALEGPCGSEDDAGPVDGGPDGGGGGGGGGCCTVAPGAQRGGESLVLLGVLAAIAAIVVRRGRRT